MNCIADYGFLSGCHSAALIDRAGSAEWWCVPRFDSASVFARLLGPEAGHWSLRPTPGFEVERRYVADSLVLEAVFRTANGEVTVTDALGLELGARGHAIGRRSPHVLLRRVEGSHGTVEMATEFAPRMEYGLTVPHVLTPRMGWCGAALSRLDLSGTVTLSPSAGQATGRFTVNAGEQVDFRLAFRPSSGGSETSDPADHTTVEDTIAGWNSWTQLHDGYKGRHRAAVRRSSLVLQGLTFQPTGGGGGSGDDSATGEARRGPQL